MTSRSVFWLATLTVLAGVCAPRSAAGPQSWYPPARSPSARSCAATLGPPVASADLGRPVPLDSSDPVHLVAPTTGVAPVAWQPVVAPPVFRGQGPDLPPIPPVGLYGPSPVPPPTTTTSNAPYGPPPGDLGYNAGVAVDRPLKGTFWESICGWCGHVFHPTSGCNQGLFQSDQGFKDFFISPVTNPFYFEDPRSLTEVRPLFIYQKAPNSNPIFAGGNSEFYGLQARLAICENFSVVFPKIGFVTLNPHAPVGEFQEATGVSELVLGPKITFLRLPCHGTVAAAGVNFDIPLGPHKVFQDTGTLSIDPYVTLAQNINLRSWGSINLMSELGYSIGIDNRRSDFLHSAFHIDYDIANMHKFYPLFEVNWFQYTMNGKAQPINFEGTDLVNFGATNVSGQTIITLGPGLRYKFCEAVQLGAAAEWAVTKHKDLTDFRLTFDVIFRY